MKVPKTPCPIQGLVPWFRGVFPIVRKEAHPHFIWLYVIHSKREGEGFIIHYNVSQFDLVKEMDLQCKFRKGQTVDLGPFARRRIERVRWDFAKGEPGYTIQGTRDNNGWYILQSELIRRIEEAEVNSGVIHRQKLATSGTE